MASPSSGQAALARAFPAVIAPGARALILGSMPGQRSLAESRYYAHPRNAFWPIMRDCLAPQSPAPGSADWSYAESLRMLTAKGLALWDVLHACSRRGSLDAAIDSASMVVNDFAGLWSEHPGIECVLLNGGTAASLFRRHVLPRLGAAPRCFDLPSTSPAHAGMPYAEKCARWRTALACALEHPHD